MKIRRLIRKCKGKLIHRFAPLEYAQRVGVNFPRGGGYFCMEI